MSRYIIRNYYSLKGSTRCIYLSSSYPILALSVLLENRVINFVYGMLYKNNTMSNPEEYFKEIGIDWTSVLTESKEQQEVSGDMAGENMPGQVKKAEKGVLTASGLTDCVAVAVYDESTETGYLGHFITQGKELGDLVSNIRTFNSLLKMDDIDYSHSRAVAGGLDYGVDLSGRFLDEGQEVDQIAAEGAVRNMFDRYMAENFRDHEVRWGYEETSGPRESPGAKLVLDANVGQINYDRHGDFSDVPSEQGANVQDIK